ncbi:NADP-dependent oxidoreductase [Aurantiacibacter rhizosphaerae]|uniref:Zinc-binding dehydrogenase n=1 Tax=Aurantiacibacter rhizosphaerae TaxID=2691582 RepID=A0A844XFC4_9SPHN|nr:NADP-dependent oxidoreductase [Aurantiacibacter rhizosphaerae]MWV28453.1 zinc-binding dehydrogenase [Aurantiacibacter rhizosphaerae]
MKAYQLTAYGDADKGQLRDVAMPKPGVGQVLIKVKAAGLNPVDYKIRQGKLKPILRMDLPITMGNELSGVVESCGKGANRFPPGTRVCVRVGKEAMGAFAEYAVVEEAHIAAIPASMDFTQAAAIPLAGLTALQALRDELGVGPGYRVLITGGAGGVGTLAIQIAKSLGAHVITTASSRGRELVEKMGADEVVDYENAQFEDEIDSVDGAFDLIGGETLERTFQVVKEGGRTVSIAGTPEPRTAMQDLGGRFGLAAVFWAMSRDLRKQASDAGVDYRYLFMHPSGSELTYLVTLAQRGQMQAVIDSTYPFEKIADAMAELEDGHAKGKIMVTMDD